MQPEVAHVALAHIARLYRVERDAKELIGPDGLGSEPAWLAWHRQRLGLRQQLSCPLLGEFRHWLQGHRAERAAQEPDLPSVAVRVADVGTGWSATARMDRLSIDNNLSERMVRPVAIGRKNYLFLGSDNGGNAAAVLYSVMASAKANQVEPFAYVRDLVVQLSGHSPPAARGATP